MFSNNPRSNRLYWEAFLTLLAEGAKGPLRKLEHIKFNFCLAGESKYLARQLSEVNWTQLESLLCRFPRLRTLEVVTEHRGANMANDEMAWKSISESLPLMAKKGYLIRGDK